MKGADSGIGLIVRYCLITGGPANESPFNRLLRRISPDLADKMTTEREYYPRV